MGGDGVAGREVSQAEMVRCARVGALLERLCEAKRAKNVDWCLHSSWCSSQPVFVALVRRRGATGEPAMGTPVVRADLLDLLERAVGLAGG